MNSPTTAPTPQEPLPTRPRKQTSVLPVRAAAVAPGATIKTTSWMK